MTADLTGNSEAQRQTWGLDEASIARRLCRRWHLPRWLSAIIGRLDLFPDSASFGALPPGSALLLVMRGPNAGSRFRLDGELTTAGRHPDSDIFLDDVTVSRRHAEFYREGARFTVRDVGSLNGTYVNRERIEEAELIGGDEVQIGKFRLLFLTSQDLGPAPSADRRGRGAQDYA